MALQGIIGKKVGMTRILGDEGQMVPVTLVKIENQKVTKILTPERDGYHGFQIGYNEKPEHRLRKPDVARLRKVSVGDNFTTFREFRTEHAPELEIGTPIDLAALEGIVHVDVTGVTKGRGFEGSITRFGHKTGRRTHGSRFHRRPGSLGQRTTPGRVYKNKEMPGHMGAVKRTIMNLQIVDRDPDMSLVAIRGSIPGARNQYVLVKPTSKVIKSQGGES